MSQPTGRPRVSVVVVNYNGAAVLRRCLDHLMNQTFDDYEVIVVDDASSDESRKIVEAYLTTGKVRLVCAKRNGGCSLSRNIGLRHAQGDVIAFLDSDGFAAPTWLEAAVEALDREVGTGAVASLVFLEDNKLVINGAGGTVDAYGYAADIRYNEPFEFAQLPDEVLYPMGCGMVIKRSALDAVGDFDRMMRNYYDDTDLGIRLWRAGYRVVLATDAWVDHAYHQSDEGADHRALQLRRHRLRVALMHFPVSQLALVVAHDVFALARNVPPGRSVQRRAWAWNLRHARSSLRRRRRWSSAPFAPKRLFLSSRRAGRGMQRVLTSPRIGVVVDAVRVDGHQELDALHYGWHAAERGDHGTYRWMARHGSVVLRLSQAASQMSLEYRMSSLPVGGVEIRVRRISDVDPVWTAFIPHRDATWRRETLELGLPAGDYAVDISAMRSSDGAPGDRRERILALSSLTFHNG